jgi:glycosyltransferase involved in cell wall biosynthesis
VAEPLVFASRRPPLPQITGSRIRTHRLLSGLAGSFAVTLVTFGHHEDSPDGACDPQELQDCLPGVEIILVPGRRGAKRLTQAASLFSMRSATMGAYRLSPFGVALRRAVASRRPRLVHFDDSAVAQFGPLPGALNVYAAHNVEHQTLQRVAVGDRGLRRWFNGVEWRKVLVEESRLWRTMDLTLAVSPLDAAHMVAGGARRVELCPNGTDPVSPLPLTLRRDAEPLRLLFVGAGNYRPNERGLAWFIGHVLPRVRERVPTVLDVVGSPPDRPVRSQGVVYSGPVPSVRPAYEKAHAAIVPVFEGSGTRLKVVEAMAHGRPVVSTTLGAEGLPVEPGRHYLGADDADGFADALVRLATAHQDGHGWLDELLAEARAAISELFWPVITGNLVALYQAEVERLRAAPADARPLSPPQGG